MADFEAPSFSLGFDLDLGPEPQTPAPAPSSIEPAPAPAPSSIEPAPRPSSVVESPCELQEDGNFVPQIVDSDPDPDHAAPVLRRLRRGPNIAPASAQKKQSVDHSCDLDDDIECFTSQEDRRGDDCLSTRYNSVCSSSKFSLHGHSVLIESHSKDRRKKQAPNCSVSANLEGCNNKFIFPELTISPLRRFQLLDSDSDDSSVTRSTNERNGPSKGKQMTGQKTIASGEKIKKASVYMDQTKDLWEDFSQMKNFSVPTPALDEACEEYFRTLKEKDAAQKLQTVPVSKDISHHRTTNISKDVEEQWDLCGSLPPAHRYYFHEDPRIQNLVRSRLPNFFPLGILNNKGNRQLDATSIDYMKQFNHGDGSKRKAARTQYTQGHGLLETWEVNNIGGSTKSRKKSKKPSDAGVSRTSGNWVNPKCSASSPKNAGKRRVHAEGSSSGHWYTASDGRRVYVTKNGQELAGRIAYRHYRKESGAGFKRSKKKAPARKKR